MNPVLYILSRKPGHSVIGYMAATPLVAISFLAMVLLNASGGAIGLYLLIPAIFISSVMFGLGPGIYATALCTALIYVYLKPSSAIFVSPSSLLAIVIFDAVCLGMAAVSYELRRAWENANTAERTKDLLLQEMGHRVNNNLALVISVLTFQARSKSNLEVRHALEKAVLRIKAISQAHMYFRPMSDDGVIEMRGYLEALCAHLAEALRDVRMIAIEIDADEIHLPTNVAIPVGLIVNELVTNALKHAFPDVHAGTIRVVLRKGSVVTVTVEDDGVGCPKAPTEEIGTRLMRMFAEQLGAQIAWQTANPGCRVEVVIPSM